ncbi:MAG TPA: zinc-binding dehydrogenase [Baekduia sp.]|nr:zinc-binding dehydrogenase [Baekduia sp.]
MSGAPTMRAAAITRLGDLDSVGVAQVPAPPAPGVGEVAVEVAAAGVALPDLLVARGSYGGVELALPQPIGIEFAGTVVATGDGVVRLRAGDRVCGMVFPPQGGASERLVVPENDLGLVPDALTLEQAAAVPSAYMTAEVALHRMGHLHKGERVLVLAGASGVGLAAIQLAVLAGAEVHAATSPAKRTALLEAGATKVYDYTADDWESAVPPMDLVLDPVGGQSFTRCYGLLRVGGRIAVLDAISRQPRDVGTTDYQPPTPEEQIDPLQLMFDGRTVLGANMPLFWDGDGGQAPLLDQVLSYFAGSDLRPIVARVFPTAEAADALRFVEQRKNVGRVVLSLR